jgi:hypothetical protein
MIPSAKGKRAPILQRRCSSFPRNQSTQCPAARVLGRTMFNRTLMQRFMLLNRIYSKEVVNTLQVIPSLTFTSKSTTTPLGTK